MPGEQREDRPRKDELLDALGAGFIGEELESHIATCAACGELRLKLSPPQLLVVAIWRITVPVAGWVLLRQKWAGGGAARTK